MAVNRETVDLSGYPDLVVIYLGMKVRSLKGLRTLIRTGPEIARSVAAKPDGLLAHETFLMGLAPPHVAFRQYWRDRDALLAFTRAAIHDGWWKAFLRDPGGTGFWHETYTMQGGMEAIYDDMDTPLGFGAFAPPMPASGPMMTAADRLARRRAREQQAPDARSN